jgi:hypothetical protein
MEGRKQGVSIRISTEDVEKIKQIARRLEVRDSDVIRYAIKGMLNRLSPLDVTGSYGRNVLPVFIENGAELARTFGLDTTKLERIINGDVAVPGESVSRKDIELLAMSGTADGYLRMRIREIVRQDSDSKDIAAMLQEYLYGKYLMQEESLAD